MNRWNVIALYACIICLISMSCIIFHGVTTSQSVLKLTMPWYLEASLNNNMYNFQDNRSYVNFRCPPIKSDTQCLLTGKSDDEITAMRERDAAGYRVKETNRAKEMALKSLVDSMVAIFISLIFFTIHWRILRRSLTSPVQQI